MLKKIQEPKMGIILVEKDHSSFSLENEISKIKISLPFNEILRNYEYRDQISKMLKTEETSDSLNPQDDHPTIMFGPLVESADDDVPPFYISLRFLDLILHNTTMDSGASHNSMPKVIMDNLGLDITIHYKDLYSFDSRKVKYLG